jgi:hypothetical protein
MKTILIIGDSWGAPNYSRSWNTPPEAHTEFKLRNLGYNVLNFSLNGGSINETIEYATQVIENIRSNKEVDPRIFGEIEGKRTTYATRDDDVKEMPIPNYKGEKIDWIVWFHTEALRDSRFHLTNMYKYIPLPEVHMMCLRAGYQAFQNLVTVAGPDVKTAIIGGQAPVDPILYEYHQPTFIIEDWKSELLGIDLPKVYTLSNIDWVEKSGMPLEEKMKILDNHKLILDLMSHHRELFFDACHPGDKPHTILTEKLHQLIQSV